ncbi:hypothetical protein CYMTET_13934 [Cymbomonas tetramitiformis]|uniref:Uncharacterized protein n=1 Tax=Cymbomonas tetramitiformis TaxID=36881 RepID=A0AAE0LAW1_9CHLO|nr:hypothetical protein CYMTET_13934 [Cymbomonas tetramitiformis]
MLEPLKAQRTLHARFKRYSDEHLGIPGVFLLGLVAFISFYLLFRSKCLRCLPPIRCSKRTEHMPMAPFCYSVLQAQGADAYRA